MKPKLQEVIKRLPDNDYNVSKTAREVGYSNSYANTLIHTTIRKYIQRDENELREEFIKGLDKDIKRFKKKDKDNSNYVRVKELKSKILGLQIDKSESKYMFIPEDKTILDKYTS